MPKETYISTKTAIQEPYINTKTDITAPYFTLEGDLLTLAGMRCAERQG